MKTTTRAIAAPPQVLSKSLASQIAVVMTVEGGEALMLLTRLGEIPVASHADSVSALKVGDRVVFIETDKGAIITHRLRKPGERPTTGFSINPDGSLTVSTTGGIKLTTDRATIELRADGRVLVDGREIYAIADGLHRLQGATIALN